MTGSSPSDTLTQDPVDRPLDYEVIVIGAGVAGIYQIKRLIDDGVAATVLDANADLGGTWYKNRYPGARFDSESFTYGYSFSQELLDEWHWTEMFSPQPETLRYLNFVADKFDLRRHMQFDCVVESMTFDEATSTWTLGLGDGRELTSRYVLTGLGLLSIPTMPQMDGVETFEGESFHPFDWPDDLPLAGKRVAIIGTGATAIQIIPEVAKQAGHLTVFQRRPNWAAPLNNRPISEEEMAEIRARYDEIFEACANSPGGFEHQPDRRGFYNVSREDRVELWDRLYDGPGFGIWLQNFVEIFMDEDANAEFSDYIADRIRQRVDDPELAEKLIPTDHGFGIQRVPLETHYFEAYNRDNVTLVDAAETPIDRITPAGVLTSDGTEREFDIIVYATGFDAFTGAFDRIDIRGVGGERLADKWADGPITYLGLLVNGFPNLVMLAGPQIAASNFPRACETAVDWTTPLLQHAMASGHHRFEASPEAEAAWHSHVVDMYEPFLLRKAKSWITGYNSNVDGHEYGKTRYNIYNGGGPKYAAKLRQVTEDGYDGVLFS